MSLAELTVKVCFTYHVRRLPICGSVSRRSLSMSLGGEYPDDPRVHCDRQSLDLLGRPFVLGAKLNCTNLWVVPYVCQECFYPVRVVECSKTQGTSGHYS